MLKGKLLFIVMGAIIGVGAVMLSYYGNPANTGICVSCFMENVAGSLGLHNNIRMQYLRPEIMGFVIGAFLMSLRSKEFGSVGGSSPLLRFFIGILLIIGCSVFIGCPVKMIVRFAAGDIGAVVGFVGLATGIYIGLEFVENGFQLGVARKLPRANGYVIPGIMIFLLALAFIKPAFIAQSTKGSAAQHAPLLLSFHSGIELFYAT